MTPAAFTPAQLDAIEVSLSESASVQRLVVPGGHAPHLEHPDTVLRAVVRFIGQPPLHAADVFSLLKTTQQFSTAVPVFLVPAAPRARTVRDTLSGPVDFLQPLVSPQ